MSSLRSNQDDISESFISGCDLLLNYWDRTYGGYSRDAMVKEWMHWYL